MNGAIYADGGICLSNPSPLAGTWAFVYVNAEGVTVKERSGLLLPSHLGRRTVSNNDTEFYAVLRGLEALPDDWSGDVYSDSQCTLLRYQRVVSCQPPTKTMVVEHYERAEVAVDRLGPLRFLHLKGHPKRADLERGETSKGQKVSLYQVRCDQPCTERAAEYQRFLEMKGA